MAIIEELDDRLVLRQATVADTEALATFNARIHREPEEDESDFIAAWTRDLLGGTHPTCGPGTCTVVEDTRRGAIVSTSLLIPQTWTYAGIPFCTGRIELVGTDPDYRRRGLVRRQMAVLHRWSAERGHLVQAITGIPNYYRQFGYDMVLDLGGGRAGYRPHVPDLAADGEESCLVRPATVADAPFIAFLDERARQRVLVAAVRDEAFWRYELEGRHDRAAQAIRIVTQPDGHAIGYIAHLQELWGPNLVVRALELDAGVSWLPVMPSVLRYLRATGEAYAEASGARNWGMFSFPLGGHHPVYDAIPGRLPRTLPAYAWYLRVPDLPAFLRHIAPVLEKRLAGSVAAGHTGEVRLGFYQDGIRLAFEGGRLATVEPWEPGDADDASALFPGLTFLHILFGYRSMSELGHVLPDCRVNDQDEAGVVLTALFPKQYSNVWPLD